MGDLVCPSGHRVPEQSVLFEGDEQRPQCPVCKALGVATDSASWHRAEPPPPAPRKRGRAGVVTLLLLGLVVGGLGMASFVNNSNGHRQCQTSVVAVFAARTCRAVAWHYYGGAAAAALGVLLIVVGLRHGRSRD